MELTKRLERLFERLDRKRIIYDRDNKEPYLVRFYLLLKNREKFPFNAVIHRILKSDPDHLHDHPWWYATLILKGGYWETTKKGTFWRGPGYFSIRKAASLHRLEIEKGKECLTLFIMGKQKRNWGFMRNGEWIPHEEYLSMREQMMEENAN